MIFDWISLREIIRTLRSKIQSKIENH